MHEARYPVRRLRIPRRSNLPDLRFTQRVRSAHPALTGLSVATNACSKCYVLLLVSSPGARAGRSLMYSRVLRRPSPVDQSSRILNEIRSFGGLLRVIGPCPRLS